VPRYVKKMLPNLKQKT